MHWVKSQRWFSFLEWQTWHSSDLDLKNWIKNLSPFSITQLGPLCIFNFIILYYKTSSSCQPTNQTYNRSITKKDWYCCYSNCLFIKNEKLYAKHLLEPDQHQHKPDHGSDHPHHLLVSPSPRKLEVLTKLCLYMSRKGP